MTATPVAEAKKALRRLHRERLRSLAEDDLVAGKMGIFHALWGSPLLADDTGLLAFHPHRNEIDIRYFLRVWISHRREVYLPRVAEDAVSMEIRRLPDILAVAPGYKGMAEPDPALCEPAAPDSIDAVLLPGLAFDRRGRRLGQGGGHYDRFLAAMPPGVLRIGVAYDWQLVDGPCPVAHGLTIPIEPHDRVLDHVVTPSGWIDCRRPEPEPHDIR